MDGTEEFVYSGLHLMLRGVVVKPSYRTLTIPANRAGVLSCEFLNSTVKTFSSSIAFTFYFTFLH